MVAFTLEPAERALLQALAGRQVPYLIVGLSAAALEGAPVATQDIDLWIDELGPALQEAIREAGGFFLSGRGVQPPMIGGNGLERIDLVLNTQGLDSFDTEYARAHEREVDGIRLRVLPLDRIIASKRAANRPKDRAALPALEAALAARGKDD